MRGVYLIGWAVTRVLAVGMYALTEPVLRVNVWFKQKWMAA